MVKIKDTIRETTYFNVTKYNVVIRQRDVTTGDDIVIEIPRKKDNLNKILDYLKKRMII
jgi:FtsZ-interacting cell division protein YlmF